MNKIKAGKFGHEKQLELTSGERIARGRKPVSPGHLRSNNMAVAYASQASIDTSWIQVRHYVGAASKTILVEAEPSIYSMSKFNDSSVHMIPSTTFEDDAEFRFNESSSMMLKVNVAPVQAQPLVPETQNKERVRKLGSVSPPRSPVSSSRFASAAPLSPPRTITLDTAAKAPTRPRHLINSNVSRRHQANLEKLMFIKSLYDQRGHGLGLSLDHTKSPTKKQHAQQATDEGFAVAAAETNETAPQQQQKTTIVRVPMIIAASTEASRQASTAGSTRPVSAPFNSKPSSANYNRNNHLLSSSSSPRKQSTDITANAPGITGLNPDEHLVYLSKLNDEQKVSFGYRYHQLMGGTDQLLLLPTAPDNSGAVNSNSAFMSAQMRKQQQQQQQKKKRKSSLPVNYNSISRSVNNEVRSSVSPPHRRRHKNRHTIPAAADQKTEAVLKATVAVDIEGLGGKQMTITTNNNHNKPRQKQQQHIPLPQAMYRPISAELSLIEEVSTPLVNGTVTAESSVIYVDYTDDVPDSPGLHRRFQLQQQDIVSKSKSESSEIDLVITNRQQQFPSNNKPLSLDTNDNGGIDDDGKIASPTAAAAAAAAAVSSNSKSPQSASTTATATPRRAALQQLLGPPPISPASPQQLVVAGVRKQSFVSTPRSNGQIEVATTTAPVVVASSDNMVESMEDVSIIAAAAPAMSDPSYSFPSPKAAAAVNTIASGTHTAATAKGSGNKPAVVGMERRQSTLNANSNSGNIKRSNPPQQQKQQRKMSTRINIAGQQRRQSSAVLKHNHSHSTHLATTAAAALEEDESFVDDEMTIRPFAGQPGEEISVHFILLEQIASGRFSRVFRALYRQAADESQEVAVKIIHRNPLLLEAAAKEAKMLKLLAQNINDDTAALQVLPNLIDQFHYRNHAVLSMPLYGMSLQSFCQKKASEGQGLACSWQAVIAIAKQLFHALQALHDTCNIIHGDIKPENIVFRHHDSNEGSWEVVLIDFGAAMSFTEFLYHFHSDHSHSSEVNVTLQSKYYRAPEIFSRSHTAIHGAVDIWSTACVLGELLTGIVLFPGDPVIANKDVHDEGIAKDEAGEMFRSMAKLLGPVDADSNDEVNNDEDEGASKRTVLAMLLEEALPITAAAAEQHEDIKMTEEATVPSEFELCRRLKEMICQSLCYSPRRRFTARQALALLEYGHIEPEDKK